MKPHLVSYMELQEASCKNPSGPNRSTEPLKMYHQEAAVKDRASGTEQNGFNTNERANERMDSGVEISCIEIMYNIMKAAPSSG